MYLIFDYDGTLHDTKIIYGEAIRKTCDCLSKKGYRSKYIITDDFASQFLGVNPEDTWDSIIPGLPENIRKEAIENTGNIMDRLISEGKSKLYTGTEETLKQLKEDGHTLFILSNCTEMYMKSHRKAFNLDRLISGYYPAEKYGYIPKPEIFKELKKDIEEGLYGSQKELSPTDFMITGDRYHDIDAAVTFGLHSIGCLYGFGNEEELKPAEFLINSIKEVPEITRKLSK